MTEATATVLVPEELFETAEGRHFEGKLEGADLVVGADTYRFSEPIAWSVDVTNTGGALLVMGQATAQATTECARCLDEVAYGLEGDIEGYFVIGGEQASAPEDLEGDEFAYLSEDRMIDLVPLVEQALLLELPVVPLCDDDCKGLCAHCGANLNEGPCGCTDEQQADEDNPFSVLKGLTFDD